MSGSSFDVFGIPVAGISDQELAARIEGWAGGIAGHVVCFSDTHSIVKGHDEPAMGMALAQADLVVPDGHPIAWIGRTLFGLPVQRTCGPDFLNCLAARSEQTGLRHYLFGGKAGVAEDLVAVLRARYPDINLAGFESPAIGPASESEVAEQLDRIVAAKPDVVWVGLGAPKQEIWMTRHSPQLPGMTLCGVGAAFDFHTGRIKRAPLWMQNHWLEWLYRCLSEPRRLGPRYLRTGPRFLVLLVQQAWARHRLAYKAGVKRRFIRN
jgi:N-acetylglucosaminyldiphosphoundecaprenol N-acetyl-beta-D-mannosaminyltransferase